jgi:Ca-activated chloride channel family protein
VRRIGAKTFYRRGGCFVDSEATDQQIAQAVEVEQFSDDYFDLLERLDEDDKQYLAEDEDVLVVLDGKAYRIKSASAEE